MKKNNTYFINPLTNRTIKSTGKKFNELYNRRFILYGDHCLYNEISAKKCLNTIFRLYPNIYTPSNLNNNQIPSTYHKSDKPIATAFIIKDDQILGYLSKNTSLFKLQTPINYQSNLPRVISVDENNLILTKLNNEGILIDNNLDILNQITNFTPLSDNINILYNPIQDDFIPIKGNLSKEQQIELLNIINNTLVKKQNNILDDEEEPILGWLTIPKNK